jgi:carbohydrate-selective porin OprB
MPWLRPLLTCAILGLPALAAGQPVGTDALDPATPDAGAATVRVVVPDSPHLRRRAAHLSDELRSPDNRSKRWLAWEHATGDWGGLRPRLHERGVIPQLEFDGQLFSKLRGGLTTSDATHPAGLASLSLTFDSTRLGLWHGGSAVLSIEHHAGRGVSREVGSLDDIGTLDWTPKSFTRFATYTLQQNLFDDHLVAKFGKSDASDGSLTRICPASS